MQSRKASFAEALTNIAIGLTIGFISNITVLPLFGYDVNLFDATAISAIFTVISLVRSYIIRRVYNRFRFFDRK